MKEICICAAVICTDGMIIRGHRHRDCIKAIISRNKEMKREYNAQGFITSSNRFVTREEGFLLQQEAEIKSANPEGYTGNCLYSEDLY
jgi:hypothetical protein